MISRLLSDYFGADFVSFWMKFTVAVNFSVLVLKCLNLTVLCYRGQKLSVKCYRGTPHSDPQLSRFPLNVRAVSAKIKLPKKYLQHCHILRTDKKNLSLLLLPS